MHYRAAVENTDDTDADALKSAAETLVESLQDPVALVLGSRPGDGKVSLVAAFSPEIVSMGLRSGRFVGSIAKICGGGGGGRPNFAQASGKKPKKLSEALEKAKSELIAAVNQKNPA